MTGITSWYVTIEIVSSMVRKKQHHNNYVVQIPHAHIQCIEEDQL